VHFVLVHGGSHGAWCWEPLLPHLAAPALALDLPGRGTKPAPLAALRTEDWARSVAEDVEAAGIERCVLVGHSLAGITLPRVLERIAPRVAHAVFVSCCIPRGGQTVFEALAADGRADLEAPVDPSGAASIDRAAARAWFCSDMDEAQTRFVLERLVPEAVGPMREPVRLAGLRAPVPRSYVKLLADAVLSPAMQDGFAANAGPGCRIRPLDAGHDAMVSRPRELAAILNEILRESAAA
jgi:pimeloyl-ACP methyl ester carboxylesterase